MTSIVDPTEILIADDDETALRFVADNLTADGYAVHAVADRQIAVAQLHDMPVDLMVCDPNGHTLALIDAVRHHQPASAQTSSDLPVIVLGTDVDELNRSRATSTERARELRDRRSAADQANSRM